MGKAAAPPRRRAVTDEQKAQRRDSILVAAKQVFAHGGYRDSTIADVATAAGVAHGSIYLYFESKEALFHELLEAESQRVGDIVEQALAIKAPPNDPLVPFRSAIARTFAHFDADPDALVLLYRDALTAGGAISRHVEAIHERFVARIDSTIRSAGRANGQVPAHASGPGRVAAFAIGAAVGQVACRRLTIDDGLSPEAAAATLTELFVNGLAPVMDDSTRDRLAGSNSASGRLR